MERTALRGLTHAVRWFVVPMLSMALQAGCTAIPDLGAGVNRSESAEIVGLEAGFSALSRRDGARAAFLAVLDDEGIVLQPGPVWGRAAWESGEDLAGILDWRPDHAQASHGGDFGVATGPWTLRPQGQDAVTVEGRYVTVWHRRAEGWRVLFDGGFARPPSGLGLQDVRAELDPWPCQPASTATAGALLRLDASLSGTTGGPGTQERVAALAMPSTRLFNVPSVEGARDDAARAAALAVLPATTQYWPLGGGAAEAGDLGYSYGLSSPAADAPADSAYIHLWCRQGGEWRLALELRNQLPG